MVAREVIGGAKITQATISKCEILSRNFNRNNPSLRYAAFGSQKAPKQNWLHIGTILGEKGY